MGHPDDTSSSLVRPYAVTRGRTRPRLEIELESLVETTVRGRASAAQQSGREQERIASLCDGRLQSLAEVAARIGLPLGVARVVIADMAADGMVSIHEPALLNNDDAVGTDLLERVLSGLRRL